VTESVTSLRRMSTQAKATFEISSWDEKPYQQLDDSGSLARANVVQTFTGDIEGEATFESLLVYPDGNSASFVGLGHVKGSVGGRPGAFVLQATGTYADGTATATWFVVPGSGTGQLRGLRGEGGYVASHGEPRVPATLNYDFA
jgi:hypothetical protein